MSKALSMNAEKVVSSETLTEIEKKISKERYMSGRWRYKMYEILMSRFSELNDGDSFEGLHEFKHTLLTLLEVVALANQDMLDPDRKPVIVKSTRKLIDFFINVLSDKHIHLEYDHFVMRYPGQCTTSGWRYIPLEYLGIERIEELRAEGKINAEEYDLLTFDV